MTAQLRERRNQHYSSSAYGRAQELKIEAINREIGQLHVTRQRLETLRFQAPDVQAIYGSVAAQPQCLEQSLARWNSHLENRVAEQLAMATRRGSAAPGEIKP